jgi:hypothetical protein
MKKYDSKQRKWISKEEYDKRYPKHDKALCKGKRPHNFILVLPHFVTYNSKYDFNASKYYEIMDALNDYTNKEYERLSELGIITRTWRSDRKEPKLFMCSVCKKQKYERE